MINCIHLLKFLGPRLPLDAAVFSSTLVTSPTNKGVILIGGAHGRGIGGMNNCFYELSGNSEENLTWSMLDQKLDVGRYFHLSFSIPDELIPSQFAKQE